MLTIAGNYTGVHLDPCFQQDHEIWVFNGKGASLPRYTRVFQMHLPSDWGGQWSRRWLRENTKIPVYMREVHPDIPMSRRYPFEEVFGMLSKARHRNKSIRLFTSTICWGIALAVLERRPQIRVIGVELKDHEYAPQKDGFAFWVGFAAGRGIELDIDCSDLFTKPLYGSYPLQQKATMNVQEISDIPEDRR